jgi:capsular exopolysaccharide synthesis family protein
MFNDMNALTYSYQKMLNIEQVAKEIPATAIKLKVKDPQKGIDFITALTDAYLHKNIDEKNSVAENTITFFDEQLSLIGDSLQNAEKNLQNFQSSNKILQISNKADQIFKGSGELETQKAELEAKDSYYHFVLENLENNNNNSISVPSSAGVNDPVLNGIIGEFLKLNSERNNLIKNDQSQSPYYNTLNIKINNLKNDLLENVKLSIGSNNVHLKSVNERLQKTNAAISQLPKTQRELVGIERKYRLNDNVYTYMLQKKAEAQVAKASNMQEHDILEVAKLSSLDPVSPNRPINLMIGMFMGLFIPFIFFGAKAFMDDTISGGRMVESITNLPTIGTVYHRKIKAKQASVMIEAPRSAIAESIRAVRMNAQYRLQGSVGELTNPNNLILVTSSNASEGKSFVSLNLAVSFSLLGKKTILLDFDLRKPNNVSYFKAENELGISSIISGQAQIEDISVTTGIPNFEFIPAGPIPSNPSELIGSELTIALLEKLKTEYDYVIIDTPPIGLVTDAYLLMDNADLKIMLIREKVTPKGQIVNVFKEIEEKNIKNVCWLLNDVDITKTYYGVENEYFDVKG